MYSNKSDLTEKNANKIIRHIEKYSSTNNSYIIAGTGLSDYGIYIYTEYFLYAFPSSLPIVNRFNDGPRFNNNKAHNEMLYKNSLRSYEPSNSYLCPCVKKIDINRYFKSLEISDEYGIKVFNNRYDGKINKRDGIEFITFYIKDKFINRELNWVDHEFELYELYTKYYRRKGHLNRQRPDKSTKHGINALIHPSQFNLLLELYPQFK